MSRRLILIIASIVLLILLGVGAYLFFFAPTTPGGTTNPLNIFGGASGNGGAGNEPRPEVGETANGAGQEVAPRLVKITSGPVARGVVALTVSEVITEASATSIATSTLSDTEVRYVERASGNVYAYRAGARTLTRLSNRTLPGVSDTKWLSDGSLSYARFTSENQDGTPRLETFALPATSQGGYFLESGLSDVAVAGTSSVLTLLPNAGGSVATIAKPDGSNARTLFTSALSALRILPSGNSFVAFTKASAQSLGYGFLVSSASGSLERVVGPLRGLTLLPSPSGKLILYSYLSGSTVRTELLDTGTRTTISLPLGALSDKCAWAPDETAIYCGVPRSYSGTLPDDWYQGAVSFNDRLWRIDLEARFALLLLDPSTVAKVDIDAVGLAVDSKADMLIFMNKKDGSLWAYDL